MKIDKDLMVALSYTLKVDGEVVDAASAEAPLKFVFGQGMLLPKFESNIEGKEVEGRIRFLKHN
jgi:FKBP-type peptidyl-prolyl cis-trans isomerase SlyD